MYFTGYVKKIYIYLSGFTAIGITWLKSWTKNFTLDNGQRLEFADFSRIVRKSGIEKPTGKLRIIFDKLLNDEASGNVETVNSYNTLDYSKDHQMAINK